MILEFPSFSNTLADLPGICPSLFGHGWFLLWIEKKETVETGKWKDKTVQENETGHRFRKLDVGELVPSLRTGI